MKRHLNSLFQRNRAGFDGASRSRPGEKLRNESRPTSLQAIDGYDWLRQIKQVHMAHAAGR